MTGTTNDNNKPDRRKCESSGANGHFLPRQNESVPVTKLVLPRLSLARQGDAHATAELVFLVTGCDIRFSSQTDGHNSANPDFIFNRSKSSRIIHLMLHATVAN